VIAGVEGVLPSPPAGGRTIAARLAPGLPLVLALPPIGLAIVCAVAWKFDGRYGQDSFAYFDYAVGPLRHSVLDGGAIPACVWPLGYPALVTLASIVLGPAASAAPGPEAPGRARYILALTCTGTAQVHSRSA